MGHGYIPKRPPFELYWCDNCQVWFKRSTDRMDRCLVFHEPGSCCHQGDVRVEVVEVAKVHL